MRKIREILRLHHEGFKTRAIATSVAASHSTVMDLLRRAKATGLGWPLPEEADDTVLMILPTACSKPSATCSIPAFRSSSACFAAIAWAASMP